MYHYQRYSFKIPARHDGRIKILPGDKPRIRALYKLFMLNARSSLCVLTGIAKEYLVSVDTIRRVIFPALYEQHKESARARMMLKRKAASREDKQKKNKQNRDAVKKRIKLCKEYILNK